MNLPSHRPYSPLIGPLYRIKSFVRREGRITNAQEQALNELWQRFGVDTMTCFDPMHLFGRQAPLVLEIGFGDGETLAAMCVAHPEMDFLGIEVHRPGLGHLLLRASALELRNLRVIYGDAVEILEAYLPDESLDRVCIFFPDPWPKNRHHKRRLIQPAFVSLLAKKLKSNGTLQVATDCESYAHFILKTLGEAAEWENMAIDNRFASRPPDRLISKFEQRGKTLGHSVWEICFAKRREPHPYLS